MASFTFDRWRVESYAHGWQVAEVHSAATSGVEYTSHPTYHATLVGALNNLLEVRARGSEATTLEALADDLNAFKRDLKRFMKLRIGDGEG